MVDKTGIVFAFIRRTFYSQLKKLLLERKHKSKTEGGLFGVKVKADWEPLKWVY